MTTKNRAMWRGARRPPPSPDQLAALRPLWRLRSDPGDKRLRVAAEWAAYLCLPFVLSLGVSAGIDPWAGLLSLPVFGLCSMVVRFSGDTDISDALLDIAQTNPALIERIELRQEGEADPLCFVTMAGLREHTAGCGSQADQTYAQLSAAMLAQTDGPIYVTEWLGYQAPEQRAFAD